MLEKSKEFPKTERFWFALYTRPRFEKKVDVELKLKELQSFLPLHLVIRIWSDRKKKLEEPLFPSYVFVHANARERYLSIQTVGVVRMVSFNGRPARIPSEQIQQIHRILDNGYSPEPHQFLNYGDEVEIVSGPLQGLQGFYIEDRGRNRLVVSVHAIRQSIAIDVDRARIRQVTTSEHSFPRNSKSKYFV